MRASASLAMKMWPSRVDCQIATGERFTMSRNFFSDARRASWAASSSVTSRRAVTRAVRPWYGIERARTSTGNRVPSVRSARWV